MSNNRQNRVVKMNSHQSLSHTLRLSDRPSRSGASSRARTSIGRAFSNRLVLVPLCALAALGGASSAQAAAVPATATVVTPIAVSTTTNMGFGSFAPTAAAGTVVLSTTGTRTASTATLIAGATATTTSQAVLAVAGDTTATFSIAVSGGSLTLAASALSPLTVGTYTVQVGSGSVQTSSYTGALVAGAATLNIGGTLTYAASQPGGSYSTANPSGTPLTVTVAYN